MNGQPSSIAVAFLARGADSGWYSSCDRFLRSYQRWISGVDHTLYIIFKGFSDEYTLNEAKDLFKCLDHIPIYLGDKNLDIGAYIEWANQISEEIICVFNTMSEILTKNWLLKLFVNLTSPNVGLVGATGSYESLRKWHKNIPKFPNFHLRSNAFMIQRKLFCQITKGVLITNKIDAFNFESGPNSLTRQIIAMGREVLLVGRNGRGYSPMWWPLSDTYRQGTQSNLLIGDNQTRDFAGFPLHGKRFVIRRTWGSYVRFDYLMSKKIR